MNQTSRRKPFRSKATLISIIITITAALCCGSIGAQSTGDAPGAEAARSIVGDWLGTLDASSVKSRLVFSFTYDESGLAATLDSLDGDGWSPANKAQLDGSTLRLEVNRTDGVFEGRIASDAGIIEGRWTKEGKSLPLSLRRVKVENVVRRPQTPRKPYPYREEAVIYENASDRIRLGGTLALPPGSGPFPAVLLICGGGIHDRDVTYKGHRYFLVLSDYLTRRGIAVLRADKRGCGKSGGDFATATNVDFARDAQAGVSYLATRAEVDRRRIGLVGHSEGGVVAPMAALADSNVAFVVLMAGPGLPGDQIAAAQDAAGMKPDVARRFREIYSLLKRETSDATLGSSVREKLIGLIPDTYVDRYLAHLLSAPFRHYLRYDPALALRSLRVPALAIIGEKDTSVPPEENLPIIRRALEAAGNRNSEIRELPGLNHLFQTVPMGRSDEYGEIEETISPVAMETIASWIKEKGAGVR